MKELPLYVTNTTKRGREQRQSISIRVGERRRRIEITTGEFLLFFSPIERPCRNPNINISWMERI
jgi:hypothetical protein